MGTGVGSFDLTEREDEITGGLGGQVTFYLDAGASTVINNPTMLVAGDNTLVYAQVGSGDCRSNVVSLTLRLAPPPTVSGGGFINCSGGTATVNLQLNGNGPYTISGPISPLNGTAGSAGDPPGNTIFTAIGIPAGNYSVDVTDANGCTRNYSFSVTSPPPVTLNCSPNAPQTNAGMPNGSAGLTLGGGTPPYSLTISGPITTTVSNQPTGTFNFTNAPAGAYSATVTDANGCTATCSFTIVSQICNLTVSETITDVNCNGETTGAIALTFTGGTPPFTLNWGNPALTANSATQTGLAAGTYTVTITDNGSCLIETSYTVSQPAAPLTIVCSELQAVSTIGGADGIARIVVSGGVQPYLINLTGNGQDQFEIGQTSVDFPTLAVGTYTISVIDENDCTNSCQVVINGPNCGLTAAATTMPASCNGAADGSISITSNEPVSDLTFQWSNPGLSGPNPQTIGAGTYAITVTNPAGCMVVVNSIVITQPAAIIPACGQTTTETSPGAEDGTFTLQVAGGTGPYSFQLGGAANASFTVTGDTTITDLAPGNYTVAITDANGCGPANCTFTINPAPPCSPDYTFSSTDVNCPGGMDGTITVTVTSGDPAAAGYDWADDTFDGMSVLTDLGAGSYPVTLSDDQGCTLDTTFVITAAASQFTLQCSQLTQAGPGGVADGTGQIIVLNGNPEFSFDLLSGGTLVTSGSGPKDTLLFQNLPVGTYDVAVQDGLGCVDTCTFSITESPVVCNLMVAVDSVRNPVCFGDDDGYIGLSTTGATGPVTYQWNNPSAGGQSPGNLPPGDYFAIAIDQQGCRDTTQTVTITEPTELMGSIFNEQGVSAPGASDGSVTVTFSGGNPPYGINFFPVIDSTFIVDQAGSITYDGLPAGTYSAFVTFGPGFCPIALSFTISEQDACIATADFTVTDVNCVGADDGSITIVPTSGNDPAATVIDWDDDAFDGLSTLTDLSPGNYPLTLADDLGCILDTILVIEEPAVSVSLNCGQLSPAGAGGVMDGVAQIAIINGNPNFTVDLLSNGSLLSSLNTTADTIQLTALGAGDYQVAVQDLNGCVDTCSFTIMELMDCTAQADFNSGDITCPFANDGFISITPLSGNNPAATLIEWSDASLDGQSTPNGLSPGTYSVTLTDDLGCMFDTLFTLTAPAQAVNIQCFVTNDETAPGANDGAVELTAQANTGDVTFQLFLAGVAAGSQTGTGTVSFTNLAPGNYVAVANDDLPCPDSCFFQITAAGAIDCEFTATGTTTPTSDCGSANTGTISISLAGTTVGPTTFAWSDPALSGQNPSSVGGGIYSVTVTDNGCSVVVDSLVVQEPGAPLIECTAVRNATGPGEADGVATIYIEGGTPIYIVTVTGPVPSIFVAATGMVAYNRANLLPGDYLVTVRGSDGCEATCGFTITDQGQPCDLNIEASATDFLCSDGSGGEIDVPVITNGLAPYDTLVFTLGGTTDIYGQVNYPPGDYVVGITDFRLCEAFDTLTILPDNSGIVPDTIRPVICPGDTLALGDATFDANTPEGLATLAGAAAGGCDSLIYVILDILPPSLGSFGATACRGDTIRVGTRDFTFETPGGVVVLPDAASNGCDSLVMVNINFQSGGIVTIRGNSSICPGEEAQIEFTFTGVGTVNLVVADNFGNTLNFSNIQNNSTRTVTPDQTTTYTILSATGTGACPPIGRGMATVQVALLEVALVSDIDNNGFGISCFGAFDGGLTATMNTAVEPITFAWSTGQTTPRIQNLGPGTYTLTVTDGEGCSREFATTVQEPAPIIAEVRPVAPNCNERIGTIRIDTLYGGSGGYTYSLDAGVTFQTIQNLPAQLSVDPGVYDFVLADAGGCTQDFRLRVPRAPDPQLVLPNDTTLLLGDSLLLVPQTDFAPDSVIWEPARFITRSNELVTHVTPDESTRVRLTLLDSTGCRVEGSFYILVDERVPIFVPTGFSPNEDGQNDLFRPFAGPQIERIDLLQVFDRWGNQLFSAEDFTPNDPLMGWDGNFNDRPMNPGVYIYMMSYRLMDGTQLQLKGSVTLVR